MNHIHAQIQQYQRQHDQLVETLRGFASPLAAELKRMREAQARVAAMIAPAVAWKTEMERILAPILEQQRQMKEFAESFAQVFTFHFEHLPAVTQKAFRALAALGWYPPLDLPLSSLHEVCSWFDAGKIDGINESLSHYIDQNIEESKRSFAKRFPKRSQIIGSALAAHTRKEYALSIPVLLAQADGICQDATGVQLYKGNPTDLKAALVTADITPLRNAFLAPLLEPSPLIAPKRKRDTAPSLFNRHAILHGESTDYDTHLNSCRAVSLLLFVSWVLTEAEAPQKK